MFGLDASANYINVKELLSARPMATLGGDNIYRKVNYTRMLEFNENIEMSVKTPMIVQSMLFKGVLGLRYMMVSVKMIKKNHWARGLSNIEKHGAGGGATWQKQ